MSRARLFAMVCLPILVVAASCGGETGRVSLVGQATETPASSSTVSVANSPTATPNRTTPAAASGCAGAIAWSAALDHVGEQRTVRGPVRGATYAKSTKGQPTFIDVGKPYPDPSRFTVLIWGADRPAFPVAPDQAYAGKTICVSGLITSYKGGAEIEVTLPGAIVVD